MAHVQSPPGARASGRLRVTTCVVVALLAGAPGRLSHAWQEFKHPSAAGLKQDSLARFGTVSGNGRYDYWKVAIDATSGHLLDGSGAGTFQLLWAPRAPYFSYVQNAHSLYVETLAETGIVGVVLLGGFFVLVLGATVRLSVRSRYEARVRAAGFAGAMFAFCVAAASDWIWQVPALPAAFLVLAGAVLAPPHARSSGGASLPLRLGAIALAAAALVAIAVPLATVSTVRDSQAAVLDGNSAQALADARTAVRLEPGAATAQIQLAEVLELQGRVPEALAAAREATADEPSNWSGWLIVSRLEAEAGRPDRVARRLPPQPLAESPIPSVQAMSDEPYSPTEFEEVDAELSDRLRIGTARASSGVPGTARPPSRYAGSRLQLAAGAPATDRRRLPRSGRVAHRTRCPWTVIAGVLEQVPQLAQRPGEDLLHVGQAETEQVCDLRTCHVASEPKGDNLTVTVTESRQRADELG